jgi:hypothetical protein
MARIVIRCQYTGHYVFTGIDTSTLPTIRSGRTFCPYCVTEHVWTSADAQVDEHATNHSKPLVRQAS